MAKKNVKEKITAKYVWILKKIIDVRKTTWYVFFEKMKIILKANLLKGRDAKPEGAKVRKFDQVSRLHCFHIIYGKDVKTEEISITFILYRCVILKNIVGTLAYFVRCPFYMSK